VNRGVVPALRVDEQRRTIRILLQAMKATIVVASRNEGARLWKTVRSCVETTAGLDCDLLVADDASTDDSLEQLRHHCGDVRVVSHDTRRGVASTKDLGARSAGGDVLVLLDGHCKPEPGAVARLVADVEELHGRAVVTPAVPPLDPDAWENNLGVIGYGFTLELERFACRWVDRTAMRSRGRFLESQALIGCAVAMHRNLYEEMLGFDTGMQQWGSEDIDFGLKAWMMGSLILNDPDAVIGHRFRSTFDNFEVTAQHTLINQLRMARKNFEEAVWEEWLTACRSRYESWPDWWAEAWSTFEQGRESLERERTHLFNHRTRNEYWYADYFDLPWPRR
jgi:GT2 family glycosyltransferase